MEVHSCEPVNAFLNMVTDENILYFYTVGMVDK